MTAKKLVLCLSLFVSGICINASATNVTTAIKSPTTTTTNTLETTPAITTAKTNSTATGAAASPSPVASGKYELRLQYWHADWSWEGEDNINDLGASPFVLVGIAYTKPTYEISGYAGYGNGWGQEISRLDLSLAVNWKSGALSYGLGARRMGYDSATDDSSWSYLGPELYLGYEDFISASEWSFHLKAATGFYIWDFSLGNLEADGNTFGYAGDIGFGYTLESAKLRAGYRVQIVAEDGAFPQDEFMGPYAELDLPF